MIDRGMKMRVDQTRHHQVSRTVDFTDIGPGRSRRIPRVDRGDHAVLHRNRRARMLRPLRIHRENADIADDGLHVSSRVGDTKLAAGPVIGFGNGYPQAPALLVVRRIATSASTIFTAAGTPSMTGTQSVSTGGPSSGSSPARPRMIASA